MQSLADILTLDDIAHYLGRSSFSRGLEYAREKRVRSWSYSNGLLESEVSGSGRNVYEQEIQLVVREGKLVGIDSQCSCPMEYDCKHVAAALITVLEQHGQRKQQTPGAEQSTKPLIDGRHMLWLMEIAQARQQSAAAQERKPDDVKDGFFAFVVSCSTKEQQIRLVPSQIKVSPKGELKAQAIRTTAYDLDRSACRLTDQDIELIALFNQFSGQMYASSSYQPKGKWAHLLLKKIAQLGQLFWQQTENNKPQLTRLEFAEARYADLRWHPHGAEKKLQWLIEDQPVRAIIQASPPWYIDHGHFGVLRRIEDNTAPLETVVQIVNRAPALSANASPEALAQRMLADGLQEFLPLPVVVAEKKRSDVQVRAYLRLGSVMDAAQGDLLDFAELRYLYDEALVDEHDPLPEIRTTKARGSSAVTEIIARDLPAEARLRERLTGLGFSKLSAPSYATLAAQPTRQNLYQLPDQQAWIHFAGEPLATLYAEGWHIDLYDSYRYDLQEIEDWYADVDEGQTGSPWFDLELGIVVNQKKISLLPLLVQLIRQAPKEFNQAALDARADDEQILLRLDTQQSVALPYARIKPLLQILGELYFHEAQGDSLRLPQLDAARLAELAAATQLRWNGGERLQALGKKLAEFNGIVDCETPQGLQAQLRDYQKQGLAWMQFLREYELAGILADDMGLGKTIQTLAHILAEKEAGRLQHPAMVIAPTSLMDNWAEEAARFAPSLRVLVLHGKQRLNAFAHIPEHDLVLTTYALLPRDEAELRAHRYHLLILDEAQYIKNAQSKAAQTAGLIDAQHRLCLTGTPLQNHLGELWSQFNFLMPGLLGDTKTFNRDFRAPIEKLGDPQRHALLTRKIKPFLLRRTKDKVAQELPPKTEIVRHIEIVGAQADLYETVRLAMDEKVRAEIAKKGIARSQIVILDALLKLRQVCCDPRLVKLTGVKSKAKSIPSAKLTELMEMVQELTDEGRRILIFSQFTSMLDLIAAELTQQDIPYLLLTGETEERGKLVQTFQNGDVPLFLISLKAGGVGLNLTAADTIIHYDPWWNPAAENQATDRAWRIGQDKPVFVYRLIAKGTLEEKIQVMQQQKAALAQAILDQGEASSAHISAEDLQGIFAPLE